MTALPGRRAATAESGSALLTVIGAVVVLTALGFAAAAVARNAVDRASLRADSSKAYFLARGGIEAALHEISIRLTQRRGMQQGSLLRRYEFGDGTVEVAIVSEAGKINVNRAGRESLGALLQGLGVQGGASRLIANRILEYRAGTVYHMPRRFELAERPAGSPRIPSSFRRRAASIQMIEELLSVRGITPDLMYGRSEPVRAANGRFHGLRRIGGLLRFLRAKGPAMVDVNAAPREVLLASGMQASLADRVLAARRTRQIESDDPLVGMAIAHGSRVPFAASTAASEWMLTSMARLFEDRARRSVTAIVSTEGPDREIQITRWYERAL